MQEFRFEFDASYGDDKRIYFSNNQFINRILGGTLDKFCCKANTPKMTFLCVKHFHFPAVVVFNALMSAVSLGLHCK